MASPPTVYISPRPRDEASLLLRHESGALLAIHHRRPPVWRSRVPIFSQLASELDEGDAVIFLVSFSVLGNTCSSSFFRYDRFSKCFYRVDSVPVAKDRRLETNFVSEFRGHVPR